MNLNEIIVEGMEEKSSLNYSTSNA